MLPLFEMMTNAQNGEAVQAMAKQFGLSEAQVEKAMEALMPAFSTGLRRNARTPGDVGNFLQALATGEHARYFEDMTKAFTDNGMAEGNGILGHLFGSKEVSRAVAAQAAQATGIGQDILKQMLPIIAATMMGGLFKQSTGRMSAAPSSSGNVVGDIIEQMMRSQQQFGQGIGPRSKTPGADNPFGQILESMFGGAAAPRADTREPGQGNFGQNPLGQIFHDMLTGGASRPEPDPEPAARDTMPSGRDRNPYDDIFGPMFEAGANVQKDYQQGIESIFDQYKRGMERSR